MNAHFDPVALALWATAFLFSLTCHEAAHALAAKWGGDDTAARGGQATLNPLPHMMREPFGMVVMPLMSFITAGWMIGWASAPYDPYWAQRHPRRAAAMAAAGPAANVLIAVVAIVAIRAMVASGFAVAPETVSFSQLVVAADPHSFFAPLAGLVSILACLNALLGAFNLLPLPPLDGAAVVEGLSGGALSGLYGALRQPMFAIASLLIAWQGFKFVAPFVFHAVLALVHPTVVYR